MRTYKIAISTSLAMLCLAATNALVDAAVGSPTHEPPPGATETPYKDTNDFIAKCGGPAPRSTCVFDYQYAEVSHNSHSDAAHRICPPRVAADEKGQASEDAVRSSVRKQILRIARWIKKHPKYGTMDYLDGVGAAEYAIYPCRPKR